MASEVWIIGCHIQNLEGISYLSKRCRYILDAGQNYIIASHLPVPEFFYKDSIGFIYDPKNPTYKYWDLKPGGLFNYTAENFQIKSNYLGFGAQLNFYGVAAFNLLKKSLLFLQDHDCDIIHWCEFDFITSDEIENQIKKLLITNDSVFLSQGNSIAGGRFSFRKEFLNTELLKKSDHEILDLMSQYNYYPETFVFLNLCGGERISFETDINTPNRSNQTKKIKFEWSLFEKKDELCLFLRNLTDQNQDFQFFCNGIFFSEIELKSGCWHLAKVSGKDDCQNFRIVLRDNDEIEVDLSDINYEKIVKSVKIIEL